MSTSTDSAGITPVPGGNEAPTQATSAAPEQKDSVSIDSHRKLLDEKKALQSRLQAFEAKEKQDLEKAGEYKALYESEKSAREKSEKLARDEKATFALSSVKSQVRTELAKLGCVKLDAAEKLFEFNELAPKVGANFQADAQSVKDAAEKFAKEHDFMFAKAAPKFHDASPSSGKPPGEKGLKQMSLKEKLELLNKK